MKRYVLKDLLEVCNSANPFLQKEGITVRYSSGEYTVMYVPDLVKLDTRGCNISLRKKAFSHIKLIVRNSDYTKKVVDRSWI